MFCNYILELANMYSHGKNLCDIHTRIILQMMDVW
jgi:hypothetical protein